MAHFHVGASVQYYSTSHGCWVDAVVEEEREGGDILVSCKKGYWMPPAEQLQRLRAAPAAAAAAAAKAPAAAPAAAGYPTAAAAPASPAARAGDAAGEWAAEQAIGLGTHGATDIGTWARILDRSAISSVHAAVERLNQGRDLQCTEDFCVVYSASSQGYYLLYRRSCRDKALAHLMQHLRDVASASAAAHEELTKVQQEAQALEEGLREARRELQEGRAREAELGDAASKLAAATTELAALKESLAEERAERAKLEGLRAELSQAEEKLAVAERDVVQLNSTLNEEQLQRKLLQGEYDALLENLSQKEGEVSSAELAEVQVQLAMAERDLAKLTADHKQEVARLTDELEEERVRRKRLQEDRDALRETLPHKVSSVELSEVQVQLATAERDLAKLTADHKQEVARLTDELEEERVRRKQLQDDHDALRETLPHKDGEKVHEGEGLAVELSEAQEKLAAVELEVVRLTVELDEERQRRKQLQCDHDALRETLPPKEPVVEKPVEGEGLSVELSQVQEKLAAAELDVVRLTVELDEERQQRKQLQGERDALRETALQKEQDALEAVEEEGSAVALSKAEEKLAAAELDVVRLTAELEEERLQRKQLQGEHDALRETSSRQEEVVAKSEESLKGFLKAAEEELSLQTALDEERAQRRRLEALHLEAEERLQNEVSAKEQFKKELAKIQTELLAKDGREATLAQDLTQAAELEGSGAELGAEGKQVPCSAPSLSHS